MTSAKEIFLSLKPMEFRKNNFFIWNNLSKCMQTIVPTDLAIYLPFHPYFFKNIFQFFFKFKLYCCFPNAANYGQTLLYLRSLQPFRPNFIVYRNPEELLFSYKLLLTKACKILELTYQNIKSAGRELAL